MNYTGVIIAESLENKDILKDVKLILLPPLKHD